jgi:Glycosyl hydrolases family 2, sugar binding domain
MKITRRDILAAIGAGSAIAPFGLRGQQTGSFRSAELLASLFRPAGQAADSTKMSSLPLDRTLNATPAWSLDLSGTWKIIRDPDNVGKNAGWYSGGPVRGSVDQVLPNPLELAFPGYDGVVWYWRTFDVANPQSFDDMRIHFGGADYYAEAWLNGQYLGGNQSALLPFAFDATKALKAGENKLVVRVIDACYAREIDGFLLGNVPGGRQHDNPWEPGWRHYNYGGLLLPVTVQAFKRPWIADAFIKPNIKEDSIDVELILVGSEGEDWSASVRPKSGRGSSTHKTILIRPDGAVAASFSLKIAEPHLWDVWDAFLYELELVPKGKGTTWRGKFGMRETSIVDGRIAINRKPILQRSFLYNQIWPVTLGAPYKDLARRDIELARKANANMLRCFSKTPLRATVEAADELGMLLQHESLGSWYLKNGTEQDERLGNITQRAVLAYRNNPSVLWWNVLNENSPQMDPKRVYPADEFTLGPYVLQTVLGQVHALDSTRPAIANDPIWHDVDNVWEPGKAKPSLPLVQSHYYQFTGLENNVDSWENIRQRKWDVANNPEALYLGITEWGVNSSPDWARLIKSYQESGLREDAEDYALYRKMRDLNLHRYEESHIQDQGFPTFESLQEASRDHVAWRYREQMALYWGNLRSVGHGLTALEDSSYELSGVVDNWRNPKPVVFDTITELNRPLQINLWVRPTSLYVGDRLGFDATLVNERQRLAPGSYPVRLRLLDDKRRVVFEKEYDHASGSEPIEHLITDSFVPQIGPGEFKLAVTLDGGGDQLQAERDVILFERKPRVFRTEQQIWIWDKDDVLQRWLAARSQIARAGDASSVKAGDVMLILEAERTQLPAIQAALRAGGRAIILRPEEVLRGDMPSVPGNDASFSGLLEPVSGKWKPELRKIDWWGTPGAWGYGRTALALQDAYLTGLPQGKALEPQPVYQRIAPAYTWLMDNQPADLPIRHAVRESNLAVDIPYTSDLCSMSVGSGKLVLTSLRIGDHLNLDPAADKILENVLAELIIGNSHDA